MKKLLWIGDAACPSGFARATHETLDTLRDHYEVTVLGMNYRGDPHAYPYPIYSAMPGGDPFGLGRMVWMCDLVKPDVIVIQQDPWNLQQYIGRLEQVPEFKDVPVVAAVAIDGLNVRSAWFRGLSHAVFWTKFAQLEARKGGYVGASTVIPLGVDLATYRPVDKAEVRERRIPTLTDKFIIGNVNRNQPRKRWDLTLRYFAEWRHSKKVEDAWLYLHTAPTGDVCVDVRQLARYYSIHDRIAMMEPEVFYGISEDEMRDTYNCFDVAVSTTQGEGMGLTTMEAMACGVPCIMPAWSALGDWAKDASVQIPCTATAVGSPYVNVIGGVPDEQDFITALDNLYNRPQDRLSIGDTGRRLMEEDRFRWATIGQEWLKVLGKVLG